MKRFFLLIQTLLVCSAAPAQGGRTDSLSASPSWKYGMKFGLNVGGTAPVPFPKEIREIKRYNPTFLFSLEGSLDRRFGKREQWAIGTGIRLETKGMRTQAGVKNYRMELVGEDGNRLEGNWTGSVHTEVHNLYLTLPVRLKYRLRPNLTLTVGSYLSGLISGKFSGHVHDGYLRKDDPTGDKVYFDEDTYAYYDFSDKLRRFQWGLLTGMEWQMSRHLEGYGELTWGMNDIFHQGFRTLSFPLYPVYLNLGIGYVF